MLTTTQLEFCELYCIKDSEGLTMQDIAKELKVSRQSIYSWLKNPEIKKEIRGIAKDKASMLLPSIISTVESGLSSKDKKDRLKASELALKVSDRLEDGQEHDKIDSILKNKVSTLWKILNEFYKENLIDKECHILFTTLLKDFIDSEVRELTQKEKKQLYKEFQHLLEQ